MQLGAVDEELVRLWHSVRVDQLGEKGVEECLLSEGLPCQTSLETEEGQKDVRGAGPGGKRKRRGRVAKAQNVHLDGVLKEYELE
jgi:hypothetical protein